VADYATLFHHHCRLSNGHSTQSFFSRARHAPQVSDPADEAATFLKAAKAAGPQPAAFYTLALDSGARRGELAALRWTDVDL
jgi:integrase